MMKKMIFSASIIITVVAFLSIFFLIIKPSLYDSECKKRVYTEMEEKVKEVENSCISFIYYETGSSSSSLSYGANGVIVERIGNKYYAVTARHVISSNDSTIHILPYNEPKLYEYRQSYSMISMNDYFDLFPNVNVEYVSETTDLTLISFEWEKELVVAEMSENNPSYGDKIVSISNPYGELFRKTYGKILSKKEEVFKSDDGEETVSLSHNCYIASGSSGSPAFNEQMELVGINVGGATDKKENFINGYLIPISYVAELLADSKIVFEW